MKDIWGRTVVVETIPYENSNWVAGRGLKKPRGYGVWNFHFGGYSYGRPIDVDLSLTGMYSEVKKEAMRQAAALGRSRVIVCP